MAVMPGAGIFPGAVVSASIINNLLVAGAAAFVENHLHTYPHI